MKSSGEKQQLFTFQFHIFKLNNNNNNIIREMDS